MTSVTVGLARFALGCEVPPQVRGVAADVLAAVAIAVERAAPEVGERARATLDQAGGRQAPLGEHGSHTLPDAALITATIASARTATPMARTATGIAAAVAAVAEAEAVSTAHAASALAIGMEVGARMLAEFDRSGYVARGWDPSGGATATGAAAGLARLVGLDEATTCQALGVAATQAAGLELARGTGAWSWLVGKAAASGLEAALLCAAGFSGPPAGIEGRRGLLPVAAPGSDPTRLLDELGSSWAIADGADLTIDREHPLTVRAHASVDEAEAFAAFATATRTAAA